MKRIIFIFFVILLSGITIVGTLKTYKLNNDESVKKEMKKFLELEPGVYSYDNAKKDFTGNDTNSKLLYDRLSPIDGVYYASASKSPIRISKSGNTTVITIKEGEYVFDLNDIFEKYEIRSENFKINQMGKGAFFINNIKGDYKVYSFNSLLRLELFSDIKSPSKVTFDLFPSLLFRYDPQYNKDLISTEIDSKTKKTVQKSVDVLRISQLNPIRYIDSKDPKFASVLLKSAGKDNIVDLAVTDIKGKIKQYSQLFKSLIEMDIESIPGTELTKDYSALFQNEGKKIIYLKNTIAKNFIELLKNTGDKSKIVEILASKTEITDSLGQMREISDDIYKDGVSIIKNYYYISYFGNIFDSDGNADFSQAGIGGLMKDIFRGEIAGEDYFGELSDIFFTYQFSESSKEKLDLNIDNYLGELFVTLKNKDFLDFSFFLTQYSLSMKNITKSNLNIIKYLVELFQNYYLTLGNSSNSKEEERKFSALSVHFYNLTKIINKVNSSVLSIYFEAKEGGRIQLKPKYTLDTGDFVTVNIPKEILQGLVSVYRVGLKDAQNKRNDFLKLLDKQHLNISGVKNNYVLLEDQYKKLFYINEKMLGNYNDYITGQNLNEETQNAKVMVFNDSIVLSQEDAKEYLGKFSGVDVSTMKILNILTMNKDGFYKITVNINNYNYNLELYPENHKIDNITITDLGTSVSMDYPNSIDLDAKEKLYRNAFSSAQTPADKEKYDFEKFLAKLATIKQGDITDTVIDDAPIKTMEPKYISLFKQNKLLDGDFTYTKKFIDIPFSAITASIVNEEYAIYIKDVKKSFGGLDESFNTEISSAYNFATKNFENISFRVLKETPNKLDPYEFSGVQVTIIPTKIGLKEFSTKLSDLGNYISVIKTNYINGTPKIKVDLNYSKVYIDSKSFPVK